MGFTQSTAILYIQKYIQRTLNNKKKHNPT